MFVRCVDRDLLPCVCNNCFSFIPFCGAFSPLFSSVLALGSVCVFLVPSLCGGLEDSGVVGDEFRQVQDPEPGRRRCLVIPNSRTEPVVDLLSLLDVVPVGKHQAHSSCEA